MQAVFLFQSALMLVAGIISLIFVAWFFMPEKGGLAILAKLKRNNNRVLLEDALKFIFDCEYNKISCDTGGLAGHLKINIEKAGNLLQKLASMELIILKDHTVTLTDAGRSYALRIVRIHRIWERYLADETSISQTEWHNEADRIEHQVTGEETEKIAAKMGNPVFDPHGDPIPTIKGELPVQKGINLNNLQEGDMGRITHLEDEPKSIYEQLIVLGLYPGMQVYVTDVNEKKITFVADGDECVLTPHFATHITVEKIAAAAIQSSKQELLSSLRIGEKAEVTGISPNCRGQQRRRLMDLGIVPGSKISAVIRSASGDPVGYRVMGTTIGIRKQHADFVFIKRDKHSESHRMQLN